MPTPQLDWRDNEKMRFVIDNFVEGLAPSNNPLISPLGWKALIDTGGLSAVRGVRAFARDMLSKPRVPAMVEPDAFAVGENRGRHQRGGGAANLGVRTDPVRPADTRRCARFRC